MNPITASVRNGVDTGTMFATLDAITAQPEIAQFRFRQKLELVRRGLQDESPAARGSALIALEGLSRDHPGDVNGMRALLHEIATNDPNLAVRRLGIVVLKNGSPQRETILVLNGLADDDEQDGELRKTARAVAIALQKRANTK